MLLSKTAYYADFVIYAAVIGALGSIAAFGAGWEERFKWLSYCAAGVMVWTLLEYLLHRFVLHQVPVFADMHTVHHASPRAFVGTPTWLTLAALWLVFFFPAWWGLSFNAASGLISGVMLGFLWYGILHHVVHHRRPRLLALLMPECAVRHSRHHYSSQAGNFGVTTPLWDYLFGTTVGGRRGQRARPL
jgi:sterol desaturase/sphingolipid hydroxylase (fatty acid hydroxylase superfamily)